MNENIEKQFPNTIQFLDNTGLELIKLVEQAIDKAKFFNKGNLKRSIDFDIEFNGLKTQLILEFADYGKYLLPSNNSMGIFPKKNPRKMPPLKDIIDWITSKHIAIRENKNTKTNIIERQSRTSNKNKNTVEIKSMAFAIATNIKKFGIKHPYDFTKPFYDKIKSSSFKKELTKAIVKDFKTIIITENNNK